jgi:hypothetical protein
MPATYFTVEEANALLPQIEPLVAQLVERRAKVSRMGTEMGRLLADIHSDVGGEQASQMTLEFAAIEQLIHKVQSYGCVVKHIHTGLLDFLALHNGREVYLCWRYGEPHITYYHELHTGFNGRRSL